MFLARAGHSVSVSYDRDLIDKRKPGFSINHGWDENFNPRWDSARADKSCNTIKKSEKKERKYSPTTS